MKREAQYIDLTKWDSLDEFDIVQQKHDGQWAVMTIVGGAMTITSRTERVLYSKDVSCPIDVVLVGEYMPPQSVRAQKNNTVGHFYAFDIVVNKLLKDRIFDMCVAVAEINLPWVHLTKSYPVEEWERLWDTHVADNEWEGLIFKCNNDFIANTVGRMKRQITADLVCMGFNFNKKGSVRSIRGGMFVNGELTEVCCIPVRSTSEKKIYKESPEEFVGQVFEVMGSEVLPSGAVRDARHPSWRDDKPAEECIHHV